ncbi:MAG: hypothetical protein ACXVRU_10860 [Gaiellaceae bacterium]
MSAQAVACSYAVGAALLGFWLFARYPAFGPRTIRTAFLLVACAYCVLLGAGPATAEAKALAGPVVALVGVYLPILAFAFWTAIHLLRATIAVRGRFPS